MFRVRALRRFGLILVCWRAALFAAEPTSLHVQWSVFSGRPDPTFVVNDVDAVRQFSAAIAALPPHPTLTGNAAVIPSRLGYRGFFVRPTGMSGVAEVEVFATVVALIAPGGERSIRFDQDATVERLLFQFGRAQGVTPADPVTPMEDDGAHVERSITISLDAPGGRISAARPSLRPPITVTAGTRVKLVATRADEARTDVRWVKDSREVTTGGRVLEFVASTSDSGLYWAVVGDGMGSTTTAQAELLVTSRAGQRLLNLSVLGRVDAEQPQLSAGLTIEPGPRNSGTLVLVRAIGPALTDFGVAGAVRDPVLRVVDARGEPVSPSATALALPPLAEATQRAGAFALPSGSRDVARLYFFPAGAYTLHVSSTSGAPGVVLLEAFEVPLN